MSNCTKRFLFQDLFAARNGDFALVTEVAEVAAYLLRAEFGGMTSLVQLARRMGRDLDLNEFHWCDGLQRVLSLARHPKLELKRPHDRHSELQAAIVFDPTNPWDAA